MGMPELIERHDDSSEEDTVEFSVGSSTVTSDTESVTDVNEDYSVEERSIGTSESSVIVIENLEAVEEGGVPAWYTACSACEQYGYVGHANGACTDIRPMEISVQPGQYVDCRAIVANELRRLGI